MTPLYQSLKSAGIISGVCDHCVTAFGGEKDLVRKEGLPLVSEYNGHPSIAKLVSSGYQIITLWKNNYVLVINPFFENTKKVLSNLKDYYVYWKINHNTDIKSRKTVSFREKPEIMY